MNTMAEMKKEVANWISVYSKDSLMPNTILTLVYNVIKIQENRHIEQGTNKVFMYNQLPGTSDGIPY